LHVAVACHCLTVPERRDRSPSVHWPRSRAISTRVALASVLSDRALEVANAVSAADTTPGSTAAVAVIGGSRVFRTISERAVTSESGGSPRNGRVLATRARANTRSDVSRVAVTVSYRCNHLGQASEPTATLG
jgi:5-enolpyruvylshikimate-3-phosphate synthase